MFRRDFIKYCAVTPILTLVEFPSVTTKLPHLEEIRNALLGQSFLKMEEYNFHIGEINIKKSKVYLDGCTALLGKRWEWYALVERDINRTGCIAVGASVDVKREWCDRKDVDNVTTYLNKEFHNFLTSMLQRYYVYGDDSWKNLGRSLTKRPTPAIV
jgi:hypothetical protein